tara:strand:+ start:682 stop:1032 length:351 start_codon:yes stop_codon:yes gene_type:complete
MSATDGKITLAEAISWTGNWRGAPSTSARAFLIPLADLQGAVAEIQAQTDSPMVRAYLAMDGGVEKLVIVGTQKDKNGVYRDLLPAAGEAAGAGTNSIWDFTDPCPPKCDPSSPLN